jgi:signal peptidase I
VPDPLPPLTSPVNSALDEPADSTGDADDSEEQDELAEGDDTPEEEETSSDSRRRVRTILEWVAIFGGALLVAFIVRQTTAQAFYIPSESMEPTLHKGDRILVNKWSYRLHDVNRGDVVVFTRPDNASLDPEHEIPDLIKRVIGLPGETIEARSDGYVYIDGQRLTEPYLPPDTRNEEFAPEVIPEGHVFVMGDNRANSTDSTDFGPIEEDSIVGRAFLRIYPLDDIGGL